MNGIERRFFDYLARGVPHGPDDGTLAPWAVVASLPFAPEIVLPAIRYFTDRVKLTQAGSVRLQGELQSDLSGQVRQRIWVGVTLALWVESGPDRVHDREPAVGIDLAADATVPVYRGRLAQGGIPGRLVMTTSEGLPRGATVWRAQLRNSKPRSASWALPTDRLTSIRSARP